MRYHPPLPLQGPKPRDQFLPYCLPSIGEEEIAEVVDSLRSGWVTTGPKVKKFELAFAAYTGAKNAVAVSSCTEGLHIALAALNIGPGDEVIVPTMTFCSTAHVVVQLGATPVLADTSEDLLLEAAAIERAITSRTRAVIPVHYAGYPCDLDAIRNLADRHSIHVVEDAAHAAGTEYKGRQIGHASPAAVFSFYATKNLCTGEGGMIVTDDDRLAARCRLLSLHGMSTDAWNRYAQGGSWQYEVVEAGYKSNMTDIQAALGIHQLAKLDAFNARRTAMADLYDAAFAAIPGLVLPRRPADGKHSFHLYPVYLVPGKAKLSRNELIDRLREANIGASVHFIPLHRHPYYSTGQFSYKPGDFPVSDRIFEGLLSLPLYPKMTDADVTDVIDAVRTLLT
ncbi:MAG TPA: DegT/DnrJ/EryC1/StrS family aminotransferase [Bryobacteraceae bacterium]|jgi:dTDP-4-amino-4,6-dideoxygalactose transaminase|nr:DegT/DnrJ/EryC1/StrS family aminotransferase [Bryobacteraceae bacterium]